LVIISLLVIPGCATPPETPPKAAPEVAPEAAPEAAPSQEIRFRDNGDGTVTDVTTELIWLKNANCFGKKPWSKVKDAVATLANGQCGLTDGSSAGNWRLPTMNELKHLIDNRFRNPALSNAQGDAKWAEGDAFSGVQTDPYWFSPQGTYTVGVWGISLSNGRIIDSVMAGSIYIWPVRDAL
jgi:hypothetical protein